MQPDLTTIISKAGGKAQLARLLGVTRAAVSHWTTIPQARLWQLKVLRPGWFTE